MKRLIITEEERSRILGMHQNAISRQYLMEDEAYEVIPITFYIPMKKDESGKLVFDPKSDLKFSANSIKGKDGKTTSLDNYKSFRVISFYGMGKSGNVTLKSVAKNGQNITGTISLPYNPELVKYLPGQIGQKDPEGFKKEIGIMVTTVDNTNPTIVGGPTYTTYEVQPTQPKTN
jgi:hypothetical protein